MKPKKITKPETYRFGAVIIDNDNKYVSGFTCKR